MHYQYHLGIDLHKRFAYWVLLSDEKKVLWRGRVETNAEAVRQALARLPVVREETHCAIEPVTEWGWYADLLQSEKLHVRLVDTYRASITAKMRLKNDKVDALVLAELLAADYLPEAYLAPPETRDLREFMRNRIFLVRIRTRTKNRIHAILARHALLCPWTDLFGKSGRTWLMKQELPTQYAEERAMLLRVLDSVSTEIKSLEQSVNEKSSANKITTLLMSIPGIGAFTAMVMLAQIGDFTRFETPEQLGSFAGLVPSSYSSGGKERYGRITKRGSPDLRWVMIEATNTVNAKRWGTLHDFYARIKMKKGSKVARVALARKLLTIAWTLVKKNEPFLVRPSLLKQKSLEIVAA
jgi:transposase